ncbi:hypothetical protein ES705_20923 [subsurface metagenome]
MARLFPKEIIERKDYDTLTHRVDTLINSIDEIRK